MSKQSTLPAIDVRSRSPAGGLVTFGEELRERGYALLYGLDERTFVDAMRQFGEIIQVTDVTVKPESRALVTSSKALDFHTDHHRADLVAWYCHEQCDEGGETLLVDGRAVLRALPAGDVDLLRRVLLYEHMVFEGDPDSFPLIERDGAKLYYSYWLVREDLDGETSAALERFRSALHRVAPVRVRLKPGEMLVIDNRRVLHGRTEIKGSRLLRRYWVSLRNPTDGGIHVKNEHVVEQRKELDIRTPISPGRVAELIARGVDPRIAAVDLEMVKMKIAEPTEEVGWNAAQCEDAEVEYKRFLTLCMRYPYPAYSIVPNTIIDTMWHYHVLDTRAYVRDSQTVFGGYFHHYPYFGLRGDEDARNLRSAFETTKELYEQTFGESMTRDRAGDCWHDCESRCWHECQSK